MKTESKKREKNTESRGGIACVYSYIIEIKKSLKSTRRVACEARLKFCAVCGVTNMCVREPDTQEWAGKGEKWKFIISEKRKIIGVLTAFHYYRESLERRVKNAETHSRFRPPTGLNRMLMNIISKSKKKREKYPVENQSRRTDTIV